jgi:hypothetical protein
VNSTARSRTRSGTSVARFLDRTVRLAAIAAIDAYKVVLSPVFAGTCRFEPTCSAYAREAISRHGLGGFLLAGRRLMKCRPFGGSGYDPVPEAPAEEAGA